MDVTDAAVVPFKMMIGDQEYLLEPLRVSDFKEMVLWVRKRMIDEMRDVLSQETDPAVRVPLLRELHEKVGKIRLTSVEVANEMDTPEGAAMMAWLMAKKAHPELGFEEFSARLFDSAKSIEDISLAYGMLNPKLVELLKKVEAARASAAMKSSTETSG